MKNLSPLMTSVSWLHFAHDFGGDIDHDKSREFLENYKLNLSDFAWKISFYD